MMRYFRTTLVTGNLVGVIRAVIGRVTGSAGDLNDLSGDIGRVGGVVISRTDIDHEVDDVADGERDRQEERLGVGLGQRGKEFRSIEKDAAVAFHRRCPRCG